MYKLGTYAILYYNAHTFCMHVKLNVCIATSSATHVQAYSNTYASLPRHALTQCTLEMGQYINVSSYCNMQESDTGIETVFTILICLAICDLV